MPPLVVPLRRACGASLLGLLAAPWAGAQANVVPGLDVSLGKLDGIFSMGRTGTYPNGVTGAAMSTTSCNQGTVQVPWLAAGAGLMNEDHPFIAFLVAREKDGRFEQISDRSFVKHGFFALSASDCDPCVDGSPNGTYLGVGCSDTYTQFNNGDMYWLGPADEIDPWLGTWDATCSYFDQGNPAVAPPADCDDVRSFTGAQVGPLGPVGTRINLRDQDLLDPDGDAAFWFQAYYVVRGEPWQRRENNMGSRAFDPVWTGSVWNLQVSGTKLPGTILHRWSGATVRNGLNGQDDGRVHLGFRVTGPVAGLYRYEYALHNRDNHRGIRSLRLPVCPEARVLNAGFRDIDQDPSNDWTFARMANEIVFETTDDPLDWNTIYNFWFESDAAPEGLGSSVATLEQFDAGPGADSFTITCDAPLGLYEVWLGPGCSLTAPPTVYASGSPPQATLGNLGFGLESAGHEPGAPTVWIMDFGTGPLPLGAGCTWYGGGVTTALLGQPLADAAGVAAVAVPIPPVPSLEGASFTVQVASLPSGGGPLAGVIDLSDGLRVRVGDALPGCR